MIVANEDLDLEPERSPKNIDRATPYKICHLQKANKAVSRIYQNKRPNNF